MTMQFEQKIGCNKPRAALLAVVAVCQKFPGTCRIYLGSLGRTCSGIQVRRSNSSRKMRKPATLFIPWALPWTRKQEKFREL